MKFLPLSLALAGALFVMNPAQADDKKPDSRAWLDSRGVVTIGELEKTLGTQFTSEERTKMEALLAQRNAALQGYNERVNQILRDKWATDDAGVKARVEKKIADDKKVVDDAEEAAKLERIRRRQPMRYEGIMARKRKEEERKKKETEATQKTAPQPAPTQ